MSPAEAEALAARTLAAIGECRSPDPTCCRRERADRERVASDLAGLRRHDLCVMAPGPPRCDDWHRYADGLLRTAVLYGAAP